MKYDKLFINQSERMKSASKQQNVLGIATASEPAIKMTGPNNITHQQNSHGRTPRASQKTVLEGIPAIWRVDNRTDVAR